MILLIYCKFVPLPTNILFGLRPVITIPFLSFKATNQAFLTKKLITHSQNQNILYLLINSKDVLFVFQFFK